MERQIAAHGTGRAGDIPAAPHPEEHPMVNSPERQDMANAIRALSMDAVEAAKSGHPGMPMGMADAATALFADHLKFDAVRPGLAGPRPLRSVGRARLDADLLASPPYRLCRHDDGPAPQFPSGRRHHRRPSRSRPRRRDRDDHRPARPGSGECRRHGDGRAPHGFRPWPRPCRPPHLCHRRRRLPDGRRQPRGRLDGRPYGTRQADRAVRRQRHFN